MRVTTVDTAVLAIAERQHGAFSRQQAFAVGATARHIGRRCQAGDWYRLDASVYGLPGFEGTWKRQLWVAMLGTSDSAIACRSAAVLHVIPSFRPGHPEIVAPLGVNTRTSIAIVHRYSGAKLTRVDGFRVTTLAQTLFDLAMVVDPWTLERSIDDLLVAKRLKLAALEERLRHYGGCRRPGLPLMRALVGERRAEGYVPPESELEALGAKQLASVPGLKIDRQVRLPWRTGATGRVDFVDLKRQLIIEVDGRRWHTRLADFDRDRWRDNEAVAKGWRVLRFTWVHLTTVAASVRRLVLETIALADAG
jgi:very-short-patch-repair endonuclease